MRDRPDIKLTNEMAMAGVRFLASRHSCSEFRILDMDELDVAELVAAVLGEGKFRCEIDDVSREFGAAGLYYNVC